jgi:hypothetical protein
LLGGNLILFIVRLRRWYPKTAEPDSARLLTEVPRKTYPFTFFACAPNFAHRFLVALPIFALAAADITRLLAYNSSNGGTTLTQALARPVRLAVSPPKETAEQLSKVSILVFRRSRDQISVKRQPVLLSGARKDSQHLGTAGILYCGNIRSPHSLNNLPNRFA